MKKRHFIKLYDQYAPRIYRFVSLKVNSPEESEDLTSEAFFKLWKSIKSNKEKGINKKEIINPRALLYRIANNLVIDFYRKKSKKEMILDPESPVLISIKDKVDLGAKTIIDSDMEGVKKAISKLEDKHQNVIVWRYLDELSNKEIADILGKSEGATRVLVHRAMNALKKEL